MTNALPENQFDENQENAENELAEIDDEMIESAAIDGDPVEPGKKETFSPAPNDPEIDRIIGRGLKPPPVHNDGLW